LQEVTDRQDLAPVLEAEAAQEARDLGKLLGDGQMDIESSLLLGWLYWYRYQALPEGQDQPELESAISMLTRCFLGGIEFDDLPEPLLPDLADRAESTSAALLAHASSSTDLDLISATVDICARIQSVTPNDHPRRADRLNRLAMAMHIRFERAGEQADLDQAIQAGRDAIACTASDHPGRPARLSNLGRALQARFERAGEQADLDQAIQAGRDAVASTPGNHPDRAGILSNLSLDPPRKFWRLS